MITKKVPMKNPRKSSFTSLVKYLVDDQNKIERVGDIRITNCQSENVEWANLEIESVQKQNQRAKSDKTYHLIISFREGENPSLNALKVIEDELCASMGFSEHQRISVTHRDTDNLHIHVAINKIHPEKFTLHEPYRDHYVRDLKCVELEERFGLEKDNHKHTKSIGEGRANDMEKMAGIESFLSYTKKLTPELNKATTWDDFNNILSLNGVEIKKKGNGFIFSSLGLDENVAVKASSVNRDFSKSNLEKKFGEFKEGKKTAEIENEYIKKPIDQRKISQELYREYTGEKDDFIKIKLSNLMQLNKRTDREIAELKNQAYFKRKLLNLSSSGILKKIAIKHINKELQKSIIKLKRDKYNAAVKIRNEKKIRSWKEWLKIQAQKGDERALLALRNVKPKQTKNSFVGTSIKNRSTLFNFVNNVTSNGTVVYKVANTAIRESSAGIKLSTTATEKGMQAALMIAINKYGIDIKIFGDSDFKTKVAKIVAKKNIDVDFNDPAMAELNEIFKLNIKSEVNYHDIGKRQSKRTGSTTGRVRPGGDDRGRGRTTSEPRITRRIRNDRIRGGNNQSHGTGSIRSNEAKRIHGMSTMPQLSLVQLEKRTEMLLSSNARNNLEQRENRERIANSDVRRPISGRRGIDNVDKYINERNEKRDKIFDIPLHKRYTENETGVFLYKGVRALGTDKLLLFTSKNSPETYVKLIDEKTVNRLRKIKLGAEITLSKNGVITQKGIRR